MSGERRNGRVHKVDAPPDLPNRREQRRNDEAGAIVQEPEQREQIALPGRDVVWPVGSGTCPIEFLADLNASP